MTEQDKRCIAFGNFLHDNFIAIQGGWWKSYPLVFGPAIRTEDLLIVFDEYYKTLNHDKTTN